MKRQIIRPIILFAILFSLLSCAAAGDTGEAILTSLQFDPCETGSVELTTNLDLNPARFVTSNTTLIYKKRKDVVDPDCDQVGEAIPIQ